MHEFLWALGSSVVVLIILAFLPLGLTLKGRFTIVITAFILALIGQAAVTTFPLWQTILILVVLNLFATYIINNRIGLTLFNGNIVSKEDVGLDNDVLEFDAEIKEFNNGYIESREDTLSLYEGDHLGAAMSFVTDESDPVVDKNIGTVINEDISFLLDQNEVSDLENEVEVEEVELGYLADIESMLTEEQVIKETVNEDVNWLNELEDLVPPTEVSKALKEAAASSEQNVKEVKIKV